MFFNDENFQTQISCWGCAIVRIPNGSSISSPYYNDDQYPHYPNQITFQADEGIVPNTNYIASISLNIYSDNVIEIRNKFTVSAGERLSLVFYPLECTKFRRSDDTLAAKGFSVKFSWTGYLFIKY